LASSALPSISSQLERKEANPAPEQRLTSHDEADNIATFLGRKLNGNYQDEMGNRFNTRIDGTRIGHTMGPVSIKMYDKFRLILRIETTVVNVSFFRHYREVFSSPVPDAGPPITGRFPLRIRIDRRRSRPAFWCGVRLVWHKGLGNFGLRSFRRAMSAKIPPGSYRFPNRIGSGCQT
jgi:hypothetical protein